MRIVHIPPWLTDNGAGLTEAARHVAMDLARREGLNVTALGFESPDAARLRWDGVTTRVLPCGHFGDAKNVAGVLDDFSPDLLHVHGLWTGLGTRAMRWARRCGVPVVVSPHGMLDPWAVQHSRWKKALYWHLLERRALQGAVFHVLNGQEASAVKARLPGVRVEVIPNGVDIPASVPERRERPDPHRLLFLGRLHSKKGVLELVEAWRKVAATLPESWVLEIAGDGDADYRLELEQAAGPMQGKEIRFLGHVAGEEKVDCLQRADAFVLPSRSEGLPIAVLEAMAAGLPVAITAECYIDEVFGVGAGRRIRLGDSLTGDLRDFLVCDDSEREAMGRAGRRLVEERFSWPMIGDCFLALYRNLLS